MSNNLSRLNAEFGQSPWLDNLKRGYITSGQLVRIRDTGIRGLTSNPTIFQKAIQGSSEYDGQFSALVKGSHSSIENCRSAWDSAKGTAGLPSTES